MKGGEGDAASGRCEKQEAPERNVGCNDRGVSFSKEKEVSKSVFYD